MHNILEEVKKSSQESLFADYWKTVSQQLAYCRPIFG